MARLTASSQDYLEAILKLSEESPQIRSIDVAERLGVSRASVSRALRPLKDAGLIEQKRYSLISITDAGRKAGQEVEERHVALRHFLSDVLGVNPGVAEVDACSMEHSLSLESLTKLQGFLQNHLNTK
ncbi:MAG: metal-dependent transcriptional regulator [Symbiobacteriaceae bacterium]|nr:metal-dependent transcriptional regulator [Symbiobacteriaceae bacterium]